MPASAGRVRMPHNNRMHSSATLKMTGIWKDTIGYDPYAADSEKKEANKTTHEQAKGLMALAKLSNTSCGMTGHLTFQCRNHLSIEEKPSTVASESSSSSVKRKIEEDKNEKRSSSRRLSSHGRSRNRSRSRKVRRRDRSERRCRSRSTESRHRKTSSMKRHSSSLQSGKRTTKS
ncbi:hypothetical protein PsorP6_002442 [Peronosclerospora sorghi]|uniref:Uncharacterized protein n=1 Tax=Peronosclerospora sorghi TaxID=230839 RepID=A0ACC0WQM6_9STRA|nr:hypothetical protein PsorP6_002442 [Peronosclerospora sorghi]